MATIFVSNCQGTSGRLKYVEKMKEIINVEMFGKCGGQKVAKGKGEKDLLANYKFYLSFENSRCPEYMTEKAFKIITMPMRDNPPVPVILGPSKSYCQEVLPNMSYIHVDDFKGPQDLAKYLDHLDKHPDLYSQYLYWRTAYSLRWHEQIGCRLCEFLQKSPKPNVIADFKAFFHAENCSNQPVPLKIDTNNSKFLSNK